MICTSGRSITRVKKCKFVRVIGDADWRNWAILIGMIGWWAGSWGWSMGGLGAIGRMATEEGGMRKVRHCFGDFSTFYYQYSDIPVNIIL